MSQLKRPIYGRHWLHHATKTTTVEKVYVDNMATCCKV